MIDKTADEALKALKARLQAGLGPLLSTEADEEWNTSPERKVWDELSNRPGPTPTNLSDYLTGLACADNIDGYIAKSMAQRSARDEDTNVLRAKLLARGMTLKSCKAAQQLGDKRKKELCNLAAWPEEDIGETFCAP